MICMCHTMESVHARAVRERGREGGGRRGGRPFSLSLHTHTRQGQLVTLTPYPSLLSLPPTPSTHTDRGSRLHLPPIPLLLSLSHSLHTHQTEAIGYTYPLSLSPLPPSLSLHTHTRQGHFVKFLSLSNLQKNTQTKKNKKKTHTPGRGILLSFCPSACCCRLALLAETSSIYSPGQIILLWYLTSFTKGSQRLRETTRMYVVGRQTSNA